MEEDDDGLAPAPLPVAPATPAKKAPATTWLSDELFNQPDELPVQVRKTQRAIRPTPAPAVAAPSAMPDKNELMAHLREVLAKHGPCDRDTAIREAARALGYQRAGKNIAKVLHEAIRTAVKRGVLLNENGSLSVNRTSIADMAEDNREWTKQQFLATLSQHGRIWVEREDAPVLLARWFGFKRTSQQIADTAKSLVNGLLRDGRLESTGSCIRRT